MPESTWKVHNVDHKKNTFRCVRLTPKHGRGPNADDFEIGYVMSRVKEDRERARERGPRF